MTSSRLERCVDFSVDETIEERDEESERECCFCCLGAGAESDICLLSQKNMKCKINLGLG